MSLRLPRTFLGVGLVLLATACQAQPQAPPAVVDTSFARLVADLSEPGGYFDTDNLISNESSYLHVLGALRAVGAQGGAYIGVGPDQNFSYIARVRPEVAFMIDVRRDNLLQHLLFKALFTEARDRLEYLCLLVGKPYPSEVNDIAGWSVEELVAYIDEAEADPAYREAVHTRVKAWVERNGLPLSERDLQTIDAIHAKFIRYGLGLRFTSHGRSPMPYYPSLRQLLLERDLDDAYGNYLADEEGFQYIKALQEQNRVIPVVGDLSGEHALAAIGRYVAEQGLVVSAFYTSNVEFYLMRQGGFNRYADTVAGLPYDDRSVIIRSYFNRFSGGHPQSVAGYASTQLLQRITDFAGEQEQGGYRSYYDLVTDHALPVH
jgi:hypothetical protein